MAQQIGQIVAIKPGSNHATVSLTKATMCSHGSCSNRILPDVSSELLVDAENPVGAIVGDVVEITFETRATLRAAFMVYVLPILMGLGVYLLAEWLALAYPSLWALAAAGGTMGLGLYRGNHLEAQCTISRRLDPGDIKITGQQGCAGCPLH